MSFNPSPLLLILAPEWESRHCPFHRVDILHAKNLTSTDDSSEMRGYKSHKTRQVTLVLDATLITYPWGRQALQNRRGGSPTLPAVDISGANILDAEKLSSQVDKKELCAARQTTP